MLERIVTFNIWLGEIEELSSRHLFSSRFRTESVWLQMSGEVSVRVGNGYLYCSKGTDWRITDVIYSVRQVFRCSWTKEFLDSFECMLRMNGQATVTIGIIGCSETMSCLELWFDAIVRKCTTSCSNTLSEASGQSVFMYRRVYLSSRMHTDHSSEDVSQSSQ